MSPLTTIVFAILFIVAGYALHHRGLDRGDLIEAYAAAGIAGIIGLCMVVSVLVV